MRPHALAVTAALFALGACGGPQTSQADKTEANTSSPAPAAPSPAVAAPDMSPLTGQQAMAVMHERHEGMEAVGKATKAVKRELSADSPDLGAVRTGAARLADLAGKASGWFHAGTGPELGKTGAKPEIWQTPEDFAVKLADFQKTAAGFKAAAAGDDLTRINAAFEELGKSCKACHDKYRTEMHH